jgi:signal transduction histidine kinase
VEVSAVIDTALRNTSDLIEDAGVVVDTSIEADLPPVLTDPDGLAQVLQNLITNAVKYGGENKWLGIRAGSTQLNRSPEVVASQIRGTGLGLTLARKTTQQLGGSLSVSSVPKRGTSFILHIPSGPRKTAGLTIERIAAS